MQPSTAWPANHLISLAIGGSAIVVGLSLRDAAGYVVLLLGAWLACAAAIRMHGGAAIMPPRAIPVRFSGGLGRFELRSRQAGRRVQVRTGQDVVAELTATDEGDELVVDFSLADDPEVDAFGAAIGRALEMVIAADEGAARSGPRNAVPGTRRTPAYRPLRRLQRAHGG